jgi:hypothetical protein
MDGFVVRRKIEIVRHPADDQAAVKLMAVPVAA